MTSHTEQQQRIANFMGALSTLLCGKPGRQREFLQSADLIVSGSEPHAQQLLQFGPRIRNTRCPVIWVQPTDDPHTPRIGLAALCGGQLFLMESCVLWMASGSDRAQLVPDAFSIGAFHFKNDLRLRHTRKAPATNLQDATPGMARAYRRLLDLQVEQGQRGEDFDLPSLAMAA